MRRRRTPNALQCIAMASMQSDAAATVSALVAFDTMRRQQETRENMESEFEEDQG